MANGARCLTQRPSESPASPLTARICRANRTFLQLSGFAGIKQLLGTNLAQTVFRNETGYQEMLEFIRLGQPFDAVRIEAYRRDGTTRWIYVCGRPLEGVAGAVYEITTSLSPQ